MYYVLPVNEYQLGNDKYLYLKHAVIVHEVKPAQQVREKLCHSRLQADAVLYTSVTVIGPSVLYKYCQYT